ncbi:unnamed protein product [Protopolystoma xenopodis]|uniref:TLC domain-containing protein n=1 Tax=Protopolystoma xenopodis TaxID=117903 RepID=A0A448XPG1_9PLAT|nr:unnamed protein product [Protopolystoma xenopodis]
MSTFLPRSQPPLHPSSSCHNLLARMAITASKDDYFTQPFQPHILAACIIQLSFYVHSLYCCLYLDAWRADSRLLLTHHVVTCLLLVVGMATR